jgi:Tfp pilus assembly protein PilX
MRRGTSDERGSAMVIALGVLAVLAVLALTVVAVVVNGKRTLAADYSNNRSFYSADAASEAGVNWIHRQGNPPAIVDTMSHVSVSAGYTALSADHSYRYDIQYVSKSFRPGWSVEYKDYRFTVQARGASAGQSEAAVEVKATRLFREGY